MVLSLGIAQFRLSIYPQLRFTKIDIVIPHNAITGLVYMDVFEKASSLSG